MIEKRYLLLYAYKAFIYVSIGAVIYIFTVGLFTSTSSDNSSQKKATRSFSLSTLDNNSHMYLKIDRRELLVIKNNNVHSAFWADDPIYGCRLELIESVIKPICIDIEYNLNGYSETTNQTLRQPDYKIYKDNIIITN